MKNIFCTLIIFVQILSSCSLSSDDSKTSEHSEKERKCYCNFLDLYKADNDSLNLTDITINVAFKSDWDKLQVDSLLTWKIKEKFPDAEFPNLISNFTNSLGGLYEQRRLSHCVTENDINRVTNLSLRLREKDEAKRVIIDSSLIRTIARGSRSYQEAILTLQTKVDVVVKWKSCQTLNPLDSDTIKLTSKIGEIVISDTNNTGYWVTMRVPKYGSKR